MKKSSRDFQKFKVVIDKKTGSPIEHYFAVSDETYFAKSFPDLTLIDNRIFKDKIEYLRATSVQGSAHFYFRSLTKENVVYCMCMSDFNDLMQTRKLNDNIISGEFTFVHKGNTQGIKLITD